MARDDKNTVSEILTFAGMNNNDFPLVSVFTFIYNTNPNYIIESIQSVANNNYPNIQHIIIDDCSQDKSCKVKVKTWIQDVNYKCEFYENQKNLGISGNMNLALSKAKGKYYFACHDDWIKPDKIHRQVEIMESLNEEYAMVYSDLEIRDSNHTYINTLFKKYRNMNSGPEGNIFEELFLGNFIQIAGALIRTTCHDKIGNYNEKLVVEDIDMHLRMALNFQIKWDRKISAVYRFHGESLLNNIGLKGYEQNLLSLQPFYNFNNITINHYVKYLEMCNRTFRRENFINWHKWYKERWKVKKDLFGLQCFIVSKFNLNFKWEHRLNKITKTIITL